MQIVVSSKRLLFIIHPFYSFLPKSFAEKVVIEGPELIYSFLCFLQPFNSSDIIDELNVSLSKAANKEKTVLITTLNAAWAENNSMVDLFLKSFHIGDGTEALLKNLLIVAVDEKALNRCKEIHPNCYLMKTKGVDFSGEKLFMSEEYLKMMWRRLLFFGEVLERGYNFLFTVNKVVVFVKGLEKIVQ